MKTLGIGLILAVGAAVGWRVALAGPPEAQPPGTAENPSVQVAQADAAAEDETAPQALNFVDYLAEVEAGAVDPLSIPMEQGIVWYGTWEAAMAEKERTGKPVALHFGSPRCPSADVCVPGTW